jgi:hypothetical protein
MGFVNIGSQTIHTSALGGSIGMTGSVSGVISISGTNSTTTTVSSGSPYYVYSGNTINYSQQKTTYHVLGEDIKVDGYNDPNLSVVISTLNVLGKSFYDELKKNEVYFPKEIEEYLEVKFKILDRDRKINEVLK